MGERLQKVLGQIRAELWFPWQQIAPIGLNGKNLVSTLAPPFLFGFSSFLQVTRTAIKACIGSKFGKIRRRSAEFVAI